MVAVGRKIKEYRQKRGMTQEQLAEQVGLSVSYYASIEQGTSFPRLQNLIAIMNCIKASPDQIFGDVVNTANKSKASRLSDALEKLPPEEQACILSVVETMIQNAQKKQKQEDPLI